MSTAPSTLRRALTTTAIGALGVGLLGLPGAIEAPEAAAAPTVSTSAASEPNPVTPGRFRGYGFDQCLTPSQNAMDTWLVRSPFQAVGIYISGDSRACRNQPNLTPGWVRTQLQRGWRLLPITLGPQASCQPRFPRYRDDFKINPAPGRDGQYRTARTMGQNNARQSVADAKRLGIVKGSTLWYDMEGFDVTNKDCRESALAFISGWVRRVKMLGYVPGVYSSAGSGIAQLDKARIAKRKNLNLPTRIWVARWDGQATTSTSYIREDGWRPGNRVKQYRGGHDETWGGVRINIDSNRLELGATKVPAENHCGGTTVSFRTYQPLDPPAADVGPKNDQVGALKCLLKEKKIYTGRVNPYYTAKLQKAVQAWHAKLGFPANQRWTRRDWISVLTYGSRPVLKAGVAGPYVRRVQRGLNAAELGAHVPVNGRFDKATGALVRRYQDTMGLRTDSIVAGAVWNRLRVGKH